MRRTFRYLAMSLALLCGASVALAQHEGHAMPARSEGQIQADPRVRASLAEIERLDLTIESARQTNDPAKMRAVVDDLQSSLATIRANLLAVPPAEPMSMTPSSAGAMDHSKMSMPGMTPPPKSPGAPGKMEGMDHSKMSMSDMAPPPKSPPPPAKTKKMDRSKMDMSGKDNSTIGMPGMNAPAKETQPASASPQAKAKDPICFKDVDTQGAEKATYKGKTYYFCSKADKGKFLADPDTYVKR